jgi:hypothetical protein
MSSERLYQWHFATGTWRVASVGGSVTIRQGSLPALRRRASRRRHELLRKNPFVHLDEITVGVVAEVRLDGASDTVAADGLTRMRCD